MLHTALERLRRYCGADHHDMDKSINSGAACGLRQKYLKTFVDSKGEMRRYPSSWICSLRDQMGVHRPPGRRVFEAGFYGRPLGLLQDDLCPYSRSNQGGDESKGSGMHAVLD